MIKKIAIAIIIFCVLVGVVIGIGTSGSSLSSTPAEDTSSPDYDAAIQLVQDSMSAIPSDTLHAWDYKAGALENGVAVLVNDNGAYWVKDNVVYCANGSAKSWSPNLDYSPTGIDYDTVKNSVS